MGNISLSTFRSELTYYLEGRSITNERLDRWINQSYIMVCYPSIHKHWELESTVNVPLVADTFNYTLDTSASYITREILGIRSARYVSASSDSFTARRTPLGARSIGWFNKLTHTTSSGGPSEYGIFRKSLFITPGPDTSIAGNYVVLEVWEQPDLLSAVTDTTVTLGWWDEAILLGAKWLAEAALGYAEQVEQSKQTFLTYVQVTPTRGKHWS